MRCSDRIECIVSICATAEFKWSSTISYHVLWLYVEIMLVAVAAVDT